MSTRRQAREAAFQFLYQKDMSTHGKRDASETVDHFQVELKKHFDHFKIPDSTREFANQLVLGTLAQQGNLDLLLEKHATHWKVSRMSYVDRNLLRMGAFEILNFADIAPSVTIDEAIEMAKLFGTEESSAFINGILDAIAQERK